MKTTLKYFLAGLAIYFCYGPSLAQQSKIDSVRALLKKDTEDTSKVNHLNALARGLMNSDPDTSILLSTQALQLAEKEKWQSGVANSYHQLGWFNYLKEDYALALESYNKALVIWEELKDRKGKAKTLGNMGIIYDNQGDYPKALEYYLKTLKIDEESGDKNDISSDLGNLGVFYKMQGDYSKALEYDFKALKMDEELKNKNGIARNLGNIGNVYDEQGDYSKALEYDFKAMRICEEIGDKRSVAIYLRNIGNVYGQQKDIPKALDYYLRSLKIGNEIGSKRSVAINHVNISLLYMMTGKFKESEENLKKGIAINESIGAQNDLRQFEELLSQLYDTTGQVALGNGQLAKAAESYKLSMIHYKKAMVLKDTLFNQDKDKQITRKQMNYEFEKKEATAKAEQDKKDILAQNKIQSQKVIRNSFVGGFAVVLLFSAVVFGQKKKITKEKKRSEELLLNILPSEVADELKLKGESEAKQFDDVTVLITDFVNFTGASEKLTPKELVGEIHHCFTAFDEIIGRNGLEKIKTSGDAYLAVCGLPNADRLHATKTVTTAQEILKFMNERKKMFGLKDGLGEIRIGINSGSVVAGIVGVKKFAYDIWGDTVNIAARMEQNGEEGKINISGATYELVKDKFTCTHRGKIKAKNKGEIDMYFVEQRV